jgi:mannosyltransferase OCH1-like enzyme
MISPILHQLWFTNDTPPRRFIEWRESWMRINPFLKNRLWYLEDILKFSMPGIMRIVLENTNVHWVLKTDVARFVPLFYEGGIYADTDVEALRPIGDLLNVKSFAGASHIPDPVGNAIFGTEPGNKLMWDIGKAIASKISENVSLANEKNVHCTVRIAGKMLQAVEKVYPVEYFYPLSWQQKKAGKTATDVDTSKSYCVHHFSGLDDGGWFKEKESMPLNKPVISKKPEPKAPEINKPIIIPKIIHRIWFGEKPIPKETHSFVNSQAVVCRDYESIIWTEKLVSEIYAYMLPSTVKMLKDESITPVVKSDILRYELLRLFGGIYVDTDVEIFRNLDPLLCLPFVCAKDWIFIGTAVLASIPYHPICRAMLEAIAVNYEKNGPPKNAHQQMFFAGPNLFAKVLSVFPNVVPMDESILYPHGKRTPAAVHYFAGCQTPNGWTKQVSK